MNRLGSTNVTFLLLAAACIKAGDAMAIEHSGTDPVRVWGELSTTYRVRDRGVDNNRSTNWLNTGSVAASRYIWRPWFAVASGSLNLSLDESEADDQPSSKDQFTTGDARFGLFPTSRFPFNSYFIRSRDEFDSESFVRDVDTTEYGLNQRYRTLDGKNNYLAEYENKSQDRSEEGEFLFEKLALGSENRIGDNSIKTDLNLDSVDNDSLGEEASSYAVTLDHTYDPGRNFTLDNLVSNTLTESDLLATSEEIETSQFLSFLSWNPNNRKDIRLTGTLRAAETRDRVEFPESNTKDSIDNEISGASLSQGLIYEYSNALQFNQSMNANRVDSDGETTTTLSESLGVRYAPERVPTGLGEYGWAASSNYVNQHGDIDSTHSVQSRFNHSLINDYSRAGRYQLRTNLTQSLSYDFEADDRDEKSIDHSYSATWSNGANRNQNLVRFFISDSRSLNDENDYFQLVNLQYTGSTRIDRYSQLTGNITLQRSEQKDDGDRSRQQISNGQLVYRHNRAFRVNGLSFVSELQLSRRESEAERLIRDEDSDTDFSLENSLLYRIGRLEVEFALDWVRVDDEYDQLAKFRLIRNFGDL